MSLHRDALGVLRETSRTFYIPISLLPPGLKEAVASAYLCMRAIDEIEDHSELDNPVKARLLRSLSLSLQSGTDHSKADDFSVGLVPYQDKLDEVTLRIGEWALLAPETIGPRIWDATAAMADRMAYWADCNWTINTEADLDFCKIPLTLAYGTLDALSSGKEKLSRTDVMALIGRVMGVAS